MDRQALASGPTSHAARMSQKSQSCRPFVVASEKLDVSDLVK